MDVQPSTKVVDPKPAEQTQHKETDDEILAWARKRGYVTFAFFFCCAVLVATAWMILTR